MQPPPPPPAAPPYAYAQPQQQLQQQQRQAGAGAQAPPQQQPGAHLLQPAAPLTMPPPPPPRPTQPGSYAPQRPAGPPPGAYGGPAAPPPPLQQQQTQQQQPPLVAREHPPRFLGPPARQAAAAPQAPPPSFGGAAALPPAAAAPFASQPGFQQQQQQQQQRPPTAMMQQMSLQQQQQQARQPPPPPPPPPPPSRPGPGPGPVVPQQPQMMMPPQPPPLQQPPQMQQMPRAAPPPAMMPQMQQPQMQMPQMQPPQMQMPRQQQQQTLRGPPTMLPPPPPAFGGVVVSGGGGSGLGGTPSAAAAAAAAARPFAPPGPPQRIDPAQIPRPTVAPLFASDAADASSNSASSSSSLRPVVHRTRSSPAPPPPGQQQQQGFGFSQQHQATGEDRHVPPPPTSAFPDVPGVAVADGGDASFRAMRPTLHAVPRTRDLLRAVADVPLAVLVTPLAAPLPGDDAVPLLDFGAAGPPRCAACRAYVNPGFVPLDGGAAFGCNFCGEVSPVPIEYSSAGGGARVVGAVGGGGSGNGRSEADAALERAALAGGVSATAGALPLELSRGTFEFLAPPAFCVRPPRPPARLFVIDASFGAGACGLTAASCRAAAAAVRALAAQASEARGAEAERERRGLGGGVSGTGAASSSSVPPPPALVGLMSFGAAGLHFYSFGGGSSGSRSGSGSKGGRGGGGAEESSERLSSSLEPSVLVVPDVDAPFSPASEGLFIDVSPGGDADGRRLAALLALLERVPALHGVGGVDSFSANAAPSASNPPRLADPAAPSGAALAAGAAALASVGGGRLHAFLGSVGSAGPRAGALALPRRGGDGAGAGVAAHHFSSHAFDGDGDGSSAFDDAPPLQPPPPSWQALAEFAAERQVGVDVHLAPPRGSGRADGAGTRAAAALCAATGGELRFHPRWCPAPAGAVCDLSEGAVEAVGCGVGTSRTRNEGAGGAGDSSGKSFFFEPGVAHGWEAVGRLRVSKGLDVLSYSGPIHRRTSLDVDFPFLGPSTTVLASLGHDGSLPSAEERRGFGGGQAALQFAVAYTHAATGSRRVRVHTLRLPVAESAAQVFRGADADALLACAARGEVATALRGARRAVAPVGGGGGGLGANASVVPAAAGLLLRAGSAASLPGAAAAAAASSSSSSLAKGADPSVLPAAIAASSSSSSGGGAKSSSSSNAPALPAAALAEAAAEALSKARERARACVVGPLASYRERCAATAAGGQLILPEALKLAPLAALALSKHPAVAARGGGGGGGGGGIPSSSSSSPAPPQDARAAAAAAIARANPASLSRDLTPRLLPLHLLLDAVLGNGGGQEPKRNKSLLAAAASLAPLPLSAEALDAAGVYCLISDSKMVLHAGARADPRLVEALGMHRGGGGGGGGEMFVVKVPGSAASRALWEMVDELAFRRGARLTVRSTPPASSSSSSTPQQQHQQHQQQPPLLLATSALARLLPEDRSAAGPSYVEYLCWLHRQIQKRLM